MHRLKELAALADGRLPTEQAVQRALALAREGLGADEAFLVYGSDESFHTLGARGETGLTDVGIWLIHRYLMSDGPVCAFDLVGDRVENMRPAMTPSPAHHVAALLPTVTSTGEMVVARGSWQDGLGEKRASWLHATLPALALVLDRQLDLSRAERQRSQLSALANMTRVLAESEDLETVLTDVAATIAVVAGVNYVSIDLIDADGTISLRATNAPTARADQLRGRWQRGATRPDPVRDEVLETRRPVLLPDVQNDERVPASGRNFFVRTLIRSAAVFPLLAKDEVLGVLSLASHRPTEFPPDAVDLIEGLAAQVAGAVKAIGLYQELADSKAQLQQLNEQLVESMGIEHWLARTDALTGIPNRRFIDETLRAEVARVHRHGQTLSVVLADIDDLKSINDTHSHLAGDEVLRGVAGFARRSCREVDVVGRYGGDEFVFVLPATTLQEAAVLAERFRTRLAEHVFSLRSGGTILVTASVGVAEWDSDTMSDADCLVRKADQAMYRAKQAGRNRTMIAAGDQMLVA
jgi:diguanylate cyclase (GGDEF)-like protein